MLSTEFLAMMNHRGSDMDTDEELRQAFNVFDRDGSGTISTAELREVLKAIGDDLTDTEINEIMRSADTDGDHNISCESTKILIEVLC